MTRKKEKDVVYDYDNLKWFVISIIIGVVIMIIIAALAWSKI